MINDNKKFIIITCNIIYISNHDTITLDIWSCYIRYIEIKYIRNM